jgi:predicted ATPase/class 3 adenylate cyclase
MECPSCHSETPDDSRFCDTCGAALPISCASCGACNRAGARFCSKCGKALTLEGGAPPPTPVTGPTATTPSAERRQLTVMFCDLVGSTALSARLDPEDMREIIGAYHRCCAGVIPKYGGYVSRYVGDGVLAYFGYPQAHEDDAERAVRAALSLTDAVGKLRTEHIVTLQVRIGIATGIVVVGDVVGEGEAQERGVVGDTPNLAARLQAVAAAGKVLISHSTWRLTHGLFEYNDLGQLPIKGLAEPVQVWQVLGVSTLESRFEAQHQAGLTQLVGRDEELELLIRRWRQAKSGDGCVVLISGEPGIGKSRVVQAFLERLSDEQHTRIRQFCSPSQQDTSLYPVMTQLERAAGFQVQDTDEQRLDKLEAVFRQATRDLSVVVPLLAALLSIPTSDRYPLPNLSPPKRKEKVFEALLAHLEELAAQQPVLLITEDAHWIDPTSLELLDLTVNRVVTLPVMVILTFRPEFAAPWIGRSHVTALTLNRLPRRQCLEMITRLTQGKALPKEVSDQIIDRTDGVPLFVEELTKAVIESGILTDAGDHYTVPGHLPTLSIPMTLNASLLARLDRLAPAREVAQIGAALGRQFSHELISAVALMPQPQLDDALAQLVSAELIFRRGTPPDAEYTFKHALVQDAAYSTLLRDRRRQIHARIAVTLESRFPKIVTTMPALLAQHCAEAGLTEKAISYWLTAGQQSVARSAMTEGTAQLQKGLDLLTNLPESPRRQQQELELQIALARALIATRGYSAPAVFETFARARALAERLDRPQYLVPLLHQQWAYHLVRSELRLALSQADQVEQISRTRNDVAGQLLGHFMNGMIRFYLGELAAASSHFELCRGLGEPAHRAVYATLAAADPHVATLGHLAMTLMSLGHIDQARLRLDEALSEADQLGHAYTRAMASSFGCGVEWMTRSPLRVQRRAEEVVALSNEHGFPTWLGWGMAYRGWSLVALRQEQEGLTLLAEGLATLRATGTVIMTPYWLMLLADASAMLGKPVEGLNHLVAATRILETAEERFEEAELYRLRGELLNTIGKESAAEQDYQHALAVARAQCAKIWELRAATSLARFWLSQGRRTEAHNLLAPVYNWFTQGLDTPDLQQAETLLASLR